MPNTVTVKPGQCLLDLALQTSGSVEAVFALAVLNGLGITDALTPGAELVTAPVVDGAVVAYYKANNITPASAGNAS